MDPQGTISIPSITQIIYLSIPPEKDLKDSKSYHGRLWSSALNLIERSVGFQRLYWGRGLEQPENVQLHIVRGRKEQHDAFQASSSQTELKALLEPLSSNGSTNPIRAIRHVAMRDFTPDCKSLGKGAPYTGSAIYLRPTDAWHQGAWPLWTHIVRHIDGCMGCAGGSFLEPVELLDEPVLVGEVAGSKETNEGKKWEAYIVYVGWETTEKHNAYHHAEHFKEHRVILRCGNAGFAEYGHVIFQGERQGGGNARL